MSRNETFIFDDVSEQQKKNIQRIANASEREVEELMHIAKKASARGHKNLLEALSHIYEISAKAMCDGNVRWALKRDLSRRNEWKTSAKLMNCLVKRIMGVSRQIASKYSAVFEHAFQSNVTPLNFSEFVSERGGLEKAYLEVARKRKALAPEGAKREKVERKKSTTLAAFTSRANRSAIDDEELSQNIREGRQAADREPMFESDPESLESARSPVERSRGIVDDLVEVLGPYAALAKKNQKPQYVLVGFEITPELLIAIEATFAGPMWKEWAEIMSNGTEAAPVAN